MADSSDLSAIEKFRPLDATTNPSLITAAAKQPENQALIEAAFQQAQQEGYVNNALIERTIDILTVKFGVEILKLIEGRVSTEVDASCLLILKRPSLRLKNYSRCMINMGLILTVF